jgi:hypothetical protein
MLKMKKFFVPVLLMGAVVFASCDDKKKEEENKDGGKDKEKETQADAGLADEAAHEVCVCMQDLYNLSEDAKIAQENEDEEAAMQVLETLQDAQVIAMECVEKLQAKYSDKVTGEEIQAGVKKSCPEIGEMMFNQ